MAGYCKIGYVHQSPDQYWKRQLQIKRGLDDAFRKWANAYVDLTAKKVSDKLPIER